MARRRRGRGRVLGIQTKLHRWATDDPHRRFDDLYNLVCDPAILIEAWHRVRGNRGARSAGVDGQTAHHSHLRVVVDTLAERFPGAAQILAEAEHDVTAYADFPRAHHKKIASTNPLERVHQEIKRRTNVVGIFPDDASVSRLVGAILVEVHDEWQTTDRRYLSEGSMALIDRPDRR